MKKFIYILISKFGYFNIVHAKDAILFLAGVFMGIIIMSLLSGNVIHKLQKREDLGKINLVRFIHEGKRHYLANPQTYSESVETLLILILKPLFTIKTYTIKDEKRTIRFLILILSIGSILFLLSLIFINTTILPPV